MVRKYLFSRLDPVLMESTELYVHKADAEEIKNKGVEKIRIVGEGDKIDVGKFQYLRMLSKGYKGSI